MTRPPPPPASRLSPARLLGRARDRFRFVLERFLLRGTVFRLLFVAALVGLTSVVGGLVIAEAGVGEESLSESVWWSFLRLTDPGYLGDDHGPVRRTVSTILTVLGYMLFMGALVAILTTWLQRTIDGLQSGLTPIAQNDHLLIIGWNSRTTTVLREILESEGRVRRFLELHGARRLSLVLLSEEVTPRLRQELHDRLGGAWRGDQITLKAGTPLRITHLRRVDFRRAAAIIVPGNPRGVGGAGGADAATIKALLSMSTHGRQLGSGDDLPLVVAEVFDGRKARIARRAYGAEIEVVGSDELMGALMAQTVRHPGLNEVYDDLLTHTGGSAMFIREVPTAAHGRRFGELGAMFGTAAVVGIVRPHELSFTAMLAPDPDTRVEPTDRLAIIARHFEASAPKGKPRAATTEIATPPTARGKPKLRMLVVGFNHTAPSLLGELDRYDWESAEVDVLSAVSVEDRERASRGRPPLTRLAVHHHVGDRAIAAEFAALPLDDYRTIVVLASDRAPTPAEADAGSIVTYLLLRDLLQGRHQMPRLVVELVDPTNARLFAGDDAEVIVSPIVIGRILAQVTLRRELRAVYDELLGHRGADVAFRRPDLYGFERGGEHAFGELSDAVAARGEVLVGVRRADLDGRGSVVLDPDRHKRWEVAQLVVLSRSRADLV